MDKQTEQAIFEEEFIQYVLEMRHIMLLFEDIKDYRSAASKFISDGLKANDCCVMATDEYSHSTVIEDLSKHGVDAQEHIDSGKLLLIDVIQHYSSGKGFDPDETMRGWQELTSSATEKGYENVRAVGEATFCLGGDGLEEKIIYYENIINKDLFPNYPFLSLCVYNKNRYSEKVLKAAVQAHPMLIYGKKLFKQNVYYIPPDVWLSNKEDESGIDLWLSNVEHGNLLVQELFEKDDKIRTIFENSNDAFYLHEIEGDQPGKILEVNEAACKMLGYNREELMSMSITDIDNQDQSSVKSSIKEITDKGSVRLESIHNTKGGKVVNVNVSAKLINLKGRELIFSVVQDISELKKAQESLKENERLFRMLFDDAPIPYQSLDINGNFITVNKVFCEILGYQPEELIGTNFSDLLHPDWKEHFRENFPRFKAIGEVLGVEFQMKKKDGEFVLVSFTGKIGKEHDGSFRQTHCVFRDISSERAYEKGLLKAKEEAERRAAELLRKQEMESALANLAAMLLKPTSVEEVSESILYVSQKITNSQFGFAGVIDENTGSLVCHTMTKDIWEMCNVPDKSIVFDKFGGLWGWVLENKQPILQNNLSEDSRSTGVPKGHIEIKNFLSFPVLLDDNLVGQIALANSSREYNSEDEEFIKSISVFFGLAIQRARYEKGLVEEKHNAEQASRTKSMFLANMSHELRTPLNGIMGMHQLLKTTNLDEEQEGYVSLGIESAKRLTSLLGDILDLTRIESGKLNIVEKPFELKESFELAEQLFIPSCNQKGIDLSFHIHPSLPSKLIGDQIRVQQILNNLVGNAVKFTEAGSIRCEAYPLHKKDDIQLILFTVSDSGVGIEEERIDSLFKPFTQADEGYKRTYQGAGLGLSIVKQLVTIMDGNASVVSELGKGTEFYVCMPFAVDESESKAMQNEFSNVCHEPCSHSILIAEDEMVSTIALQNLLQKAGYKVTSVKNGSEALKELNDNTFDLILMDIQMPIMDGVEATKAIRSGLAGEKNSLIPIVALTAFAMSGDKETFLDAGMNSYLASQP